MGSVTVRFSTCSRFESPLAEFTCVAMPFSLSPSTAVTSFRTDVKFLDIVFNLDLVIRTMT